MEHSDTLTTLYRHHLWANLRLFERCADLTDEQLAVSIKAAYGSITAIMQHIVTAEQSYFSRISTGQRLRRPDDAPPLTYDEMIESLNRTGNGLIEWSHKVKADDVVQIDWDGVMRELPKTILFTQAINHATEHREQIKAIMTELGIEPPDLQGWAYFEEMDGVKG
jgi:uncharacterized damage-inducible protein DinB